MVELAVETMRRRSYLACPPVHGSPGPALDDEQRRAAGAPGLTVVEPYAGSELRAPTGRGPSAGSTRGSRGRSAPLEPAEWLLVTRGRRLLGRTTQKCSARVRRRCGRPSSKRGPVPDGACPGADKARPG